MLHGAACTAEHAVLLMRRMSHRSFLCACMFVLGAAPAPELANLFFNSAIIVIFRVHGRQTLRPVQRTVPALRSSVAARCVSGMAGFFIFWCWCLRVLCFDSLRQTVRQVSSSSKRSNPSLFAAPLPVGRFCSSTSLPRGASGTPRVPRGTPGYHGAPLGPP
jgi:hypothetical protein